MPKSIIIRRLFSDGRSLIGNLSQPLLRLYRICSGFTTSKPCLRVALNTAVIMAAGDIIAQCVLEGRRFGGSGGSSGGGSGGGSSGCGSSGCGSSGCGVSGIGCSCCGSSDSGCGSSGGSSSGSSGGFSVSDSSSSVVGVVSSSGGSGKSNNSLSISSRGENGSSSSSSGKLDKSKQFDWLRFARYSGVGLFLAGPGMFYWYRALDRCIVIGSLRSRVLKKVAADQILFLPVYIVVYMISLGLLRGDGVPKVRKQVQLHFAQTMLDSYKLWPAVQLVNFLLVPGPQRVPFINLVALFWNVYLGWKTEERSNM